MTCRSNNYSSVIFIPENICENGLLCGEVSVDDLLKTKNYFIHNVVEDLSIVPHNVIGVVGNIPLGKRRYKKHNWIRLKVYDKIPLAFEVLSDNVVVKRGDYQIIMYNQPCFLQSELLLALDCNDETPKEFTDDHFKQLLRSLNHKEIKDTSNSVQPFIHFILLQLLDILRLIVRFLDRLTFFLKFSTLAIYITTFIKNAVWILELMNQSEHSVKLKIGNYIFSLIADWLGGLVIIYWFMSLVSITEVLSLLSTQSEDVVSALKDMVRYLMGSPADLKLNSPLNNVLGKFFLFHIDLWWAFFGYSRPLLEVGLRMFVFLGSLGLSFQLAILADLLAVATFHVYVIYVYAARLYHAQLMALASLSRVFLGRKRNPVPGRVDSCPYSTEQLLVGTIAFTVLLFLLPTTLVYYIVFTAMRVLLVAAGGLLTRARFVLAVLPLYSSTLWLVDSPTTTSCVRLSPEQVGGELVLCARPVQDTWWRTVLRCLPAHVAPPPPLHWSDLAWSLVTGRLVYPL